MGPLDGLVLVRAQESRRQFRGNIGEKEARQTASQFVHKMHPILAKNTEDEDFEEDGISGNALSSSIFLTLRQRDRRWRRRLGRGGLQVSLMSTVHCHNGSMGGRRCLSARIQLCVISLRLRGATSSQISTVTRTRLSLRFLPVSRE